MFCPKCGNQIKDGVKFCSKCGAKMEESTAAPINKESKQVEAGTRPKPAAVPPSGKPPKKGGMLTVILIILLALVLAAGAGTIYYLTQQKDAKQQESKTAETEKAEDSDEEGSKSAETTAGEAAETVRLEAPTEPVPGRAETVAVTAAAAPVTCNLVYSSQASFNGISKINVSKENVTQSSFVVQKDAAIDNTGWSAFDGQAITSWQDGKEDDGIGEYVAARFDREYQVSTITLLMGNHRSNDWFVKNNRPRKLKITLGGQTFESVFPDEMQEFALVFSSPVAASDITVTIEEVYSGTQYRDTVIAEVGVYGN